MAEAYFEERTLHDSPNFGQIRPDNVRAIGKRKSRVCVSLHSHDVELSLHRLQRCENIIKLEIERSFNLEQLRGNKAHYSGRQSGYDL